MITHITTDSVREISDEGIIDRSRREPWLFVALIDRYEEKFLTEINTIISDENEAKEVVRETFGKIYMDVNMLEMRRYPDFISWAHTLLLRTVHEHDSVRHMHA